MVEESKLIDGKGIAAQIRKEVAVGVEALQKEKGIVPGLAVVLVGEDPASQIYVRNKGKACKKAGIASFQHDLPADTKEDDLIALVKSLNEDPKVHGILVQLPLPDGIDEKKVTETIIPEKDADGFHPLNFGRLLAGAPCMKACTPAGIMEMLDRKGVELKGKRAVVVGRSNIVGKPVAVLLLERHATVTLCHSRTQDLAGEVRRADVVIAAVGVAQIVKGDWIKEGAVVIDVGMNRSEEGKLCGDVDTEAAAERAALITPVPGGVGPMTIAMLIKNTLEAARASAGL